MKFRIGIDQKILAEKGELQPAFARGAIDAHQGKDNTNPYRKKSCQEAYDDGYNGVKRGEITIEED